VRRYTVCANPDDDGTWSGRGKEEAMRLATMIAILAALGVLCCPSLSAAEKKKEKEKQKPKVTIDESEIYHGDPSDFKKAAVVDVDDVYMSIPEYKEVIDREMKESNPRYLMLMRAASKKFRTALKKAAKAKGYDLIGGLGSIKIEGKTVPEITNLVISKLPK
jgi:hypothetical protein